MRKLYRIAVDCVTYFIVDDKDVYDLSSEMRKGLEALKMEIMEDVQQSVDLGSADVSVATYEKAKEDGWLKYLPWDLRDGSNSQEFIGDLLLSNKLDDTSKEVRYLGKLAGQEVGDVEALTGALIGKFDMEYGTAKNLVKLWKLSKEELATRQ